MSFMESFQNPTKITVFVPEELKLESCPESNMLYYMVYWQFYLM